MGLYMYDMFEVTIRPARDRGMRITKNYTTLKDAYDAVCHLDPGLDVAIRVVEDTELTEAYDKGDRDHHEGKLPHRYELGDRRQEAYNEAYYYWDNLRWR